MPFGRKQLALYSLAAAFLGAVLLWACSQDPTPVDGISKELIDCIAQGRLEQCMDGGMDAGDGGMDAGDGGMDGGDGGMDGGDAGDMDAGAMDRRIWVIVSEGDPGLVMINPKNDQPQTMPFGMMNSYGGIPGFAHGVVAPASGKLAYVAFSYPAKVVTIDIQKRDVGTEIPLGGNEVKELAIDPDGSAIYAAAVTANELVRISTENHQVTHTLTPAELTGLSTPYGLAVARGKMIIGSDSASQNKVLFASVGNGLSPLNKDAVTLVDTYPDGGRGGTGARPLRCAWLNRTDEAYCAVLGGTNADGGAAGPSVWHLAPAGDGGTASRVISLADVPRDLLVSLDDDRLYVAAGDSVTMYWIADQPKKPQEIKKTVTGAGAYRLAWSVQGNHVFVANYDAGTLTKLRNFDLSVLNTFSGGYTAPTGLYSVP
ncbi:MAG: hypothetical protein HYZ28_03445 [Myxococcales bacterium]|nr:hypothetical protein [Myxococcales bacterium]